MREGGRERGREGVAGNFTTLTTQFMADGGGALSDGKRTNGKTEENACGQMGNSNS